MTFDYAFILSTLPAFLKAVGVTLQVGFIAIGTSLLVALLNATILVFRTPYLQKLVGLYVELARNTPLLIQLFFVYFALPAVGIQVSGFTAAIITMTFLGGAYLTEVLRAGVDAVPQAQLESGRSIGLSHGQLLRYVILPQAGILSLPSLFANFIFLLKETTVVSAVAVPEILYTTKSYIALYYKTYEMLAVLTLICVLLFLPLSLLLSRLERRGSSMASSGLELLWVSLPQLAKGAGQTLSISFLSIAISTVGGVLYGVLRTLNVTWLNAILRVYLELFRAIPVLVWLYLLFFGLPIFFGLSIPSFWCAVLVLSLWGASEVGEVARGALHSLPRGQREAGLSIGLNAAQLYGYVLLPQALKRMTPPTINVYTRIIKTSSLAVLIGVVDVIKVGQQIIERTYESVLIYGALFLFFFFICYPLSAASRVLERRWTQA